MSNVNVGSILSDDEYVKDAIHIAIVSVVAGAKLRPGQRIGFLDKSCNTVVENKENALGIVDPFLTKGVKVGETFLMFLLPNTITSLRHEWTHPEFIAVNPKSKEVEWVTELAKKCGVESYDEMIKNAKRFIEYGDCTYDNDEGYRGITYNEWMRFWSHFTEVTGIFVEQDFSERSFFTCSC